MNDARSKHHTDDAQKRPMVRRREEFAAYAEQETVRVQRAAENAIAGFNEEIEESRAEIADVRLRVEQQ